MVSPKELIDRTKSNLEQVSKLAINQKLKVEQRSGYITVDTSALQSISRKIYGQNREEAISKIFENVSHGMVIIEMLYEMITIYNKRESQNYDIIMTNKFNDRKKLYTEMVTLLCGATKGINCLIATYNDDINIRIQLEELNRSIEKFLTIHKQE